MIQSSNLTIANAIAAHGRDAAAARKIVIKPSPSADTRSADHAVSKAELKESTAMHRDDVRRGLERIAEILKERGESHDWTKVSYFEEFYRQFSDAQRTGVWGNGWYDKIHTRLETHHVESMKPESVNLFDILEHIVDCVMSGKARAGEFKPDSLSPQMLMFAYANTQKVIADMVEVK